ncbi:hypothetical protein [Corallococcus sp. EGB]|uniref:hypothetical protein n=1 Tax=Corallococcus sp. EGB TaxID=1521117 RepID=UPI001CC0D5E6|nr:hypothetical protein [Corallococcus sp. EGB]
MTDTLLVRLKPYDPRRGFVLRRFTYAGIRFQDERGWYRVERKVGEHLRAVRTVPTDRYAPLAFDVCTEAEAKALDAGESEAAKVKRSATDDLKVVPARGTVTTDDLPKTTPPASTPPPAKDDDAPKRGKRERE